ncbi:lactate utilization protein [Variovorax rhizosphaerae]|uniref:Lactate utilization protein n=1 Tax=Variovorax rhizosphaerae TaxID=1836200 RepID=A0ABU8WWZ2_9BURK
MNSRDTILAAVRGGLGGQTVDAERVRREAASLLDGSEAARPAYAATAPVVDLFAARVTSPKVSASIDYVAQLQDMPAAVARYLDAKGLPQRIALQPAVALRALDWSGFELPDTLTANEPVGVGMALWGIAETGSLVFHSGPETPILANFLPLHHIVLVRAATIVRYLEDYAAAAQSTGRPPPRNVNIITGASGTTDIEGSLVLGAHGPKYLHIVIAATT